MFKVWKLWINTFWDFYSMNIFSQLEIANFKYWPRQIVDPDISTQKNYLPIIKTVSAGFENILLLLRKNGSLSLPGDSQSKKQKKIIFLSQRKIFDIDAQSKCGRFQKVVLEKTENMHAF